MTPEQLQAVVKELRETALKIRIGRNRLAQNVSTVPVSATRKMRDAAQALDDAATDLLNAFGSDLPKEAI